MVERVSKVARGARRASGRSAYYRRPGRRYRAFVRRRWLRRALAVALVVAVAVVVRLLMAQNGVIVKAKREVPRDAVHFYQRYAAWSEDTMGDSGRTLGEYGDDVCCLASMIVMRQLPVPFSEAEAVNPGMLNAWLSENNAYDGKGGLRWGAAAALLDMELAEQRPDGGSAALLEELVQDEIYAIVRVKRASGAQAHDVLVVGSNHGEFTIVDPVDPSKALNVMGMYENKIYGLRYLKTRATGSEST